MHMHAAIPDAMAPIDKKLNVLDAGRAELEKQTLGFHYGDVAAALAKIWNFPEPIILALQSVPMPLAATEFSETAAWVHMGAWRARTEVLKAAGDDALASYPTEVAKRLGLQADWAPVHGVSATDPGDDCMPPLHELTDGLEAMIN
jgi:HD-like signal output (HDOD) protein